MSDENIIKRTCRRLNLTYRQLGEIIGYSEEAVSKAARTDNISTPMQKALWLYIENVGLKRKLQTLDDLAFIIKELSK
ncbi:transcriptional regulator [Campylobacter sp. faydin G-24]|uniref:Transcriptional regulator n=1 Tax=Campylobacter anatolicus TaxID=2829105 RepID=A0ABS5HJI5_9BACT|nr:transcriptional regulator [Campylobacter anatolicus]MBR8464425.1 transcriptional regulator [Campylobacter anatolicus]